MRAGRAALVRKEFPKKICVVKIFRKEEAPWAKRAFSQEKRKKHTCADERAGQNDAGRRDGLRSGKIHSPPRAARYEGGSEEGAE